MGEQWYFVQSGQEYGPVTRAKLRRMVERGELARESTVWKEGMAEWVPATDVEDLLDGVDPVSPASEYVPPEGHAGIWKRFVALVVDSVLLISIFIGLGLVLGLVGDWEPKRKPTPSEIARFRLWGAAILLMPWLYYALMESSSRQATVGKLAVGIRVTDVQGRRISFGRATGRFFAKYISQAMLYLGFLMAAFTARKQAMHDFIAETLVVNGLPAEPGKPIGDGDRGDEPSGGN